MNYKQKLGYTLLGAGIMLIGLAVGAIVAPPMKGLHYESYQSNGHAISPHRAVGCV
jgi:hypothetical protein